MSKSTLDGFEDEFREILEGSENMFRLPAIDDRSDIDRINEAEHHVACDIDRAKRQVDAAREELKLLSREYEATQNTLGRHGHSNPAEHEQRMAKAQADRVAGLKANSELEHALARAQTELELLRNELADEEADAVDVGVMNSEVLRIKMYRQLGFTPVEENGAYKKVLVRSAKTQQASTVALDDSTNPFWTTNFLWDTLSA